MAKLQTHTIVYALFTFGAISSQFAIEHTVTIQTFVAGRTSLTRTGVGYSHTALDGRGYTCKPGRAAAVFSLVFGLAEGVWSTGLAY